MSIIKPSHLLEQKLAEFSSKQKKILFHNTGAVQLTEGCSSGCVDCGAGAFFGVNDYIPPYFVDKLFNKDFVNCTSIFMASEPFDYDFDGLNYIDIHKMVVQKVGHTIFVSTCAPFGHEKEVLEYVVRNNSLLINDEFEQRPFIGVLSVLKSNYGRLQKAFSGMDGYKDEDQIIVKDFDVKDNHIIFSKESILNKSYDECPAYYYGENNAGTLYMVKSAQDYVCSFGDHVTFHDIIMHKMFRQESHKKYKLGPDKDVLIYDFYDEDLPEGQLHSYRLGEKNKSYLSIESIANFHGVVLAPTGIYNYQYVKVTPEEPIGWRKTEITPDNFEVIPYVRTGKEKYTEKRFLELGNRRITGKSWFNSK